MRSEEVVPVTSEARERLAGVLSQVEGGGTFSSQRSVRPDDLRLDVRGVGRLEFPVSAAQAKKLCRIARPALFGRGTGTLLDRRVRDTWEVPKSRVRIDQRQWNKVLVPVLDSLRSDLGLPAGCRLKASFHSMLVYAPGQFFKPHQDSEKADGMVASLVVTLPSSFRGGALEVEHGGKRATYRAPKKNLSCVAFYADCHHEIRPVQSGYRIVLTYDLVLEGESAGATASSAVDQQGVDALVGCLDEHFTTPRPSRSRLDRKPSTPPKRLVYLLDHRYTERSLSWSHLKGDDAVRVASLREAAARADCDVALALADVHEIWDCFEPDWRGSRYGYGSRRRSWDRWSDDDEFEDVEDGTVDVGYGDYELGDLIDSSLTLDCWIDSGGEDAEPVGTPVGGDEVCTSTPTVDLEPYASEYEGYMGNYGNTMDRWYRRAAVVVWPRRLTFAVRAEASPGSALDTLLATARTGELAEVREMAATLEPFWNEVAPTGAGRGFVTKLLRTAVALEDSSLATMLLEPFQVDEIGPGHARPLVALADRYGQDWTRDLLASWAWVPLRGNGREDRHLDWASSLGTLADALVAQGSTGIVIARPLVHDTWTWMAETIGGRRALKPPSSRDRALAELARPILGVLDAVTVIDAPDLTGDAIDFLCADRGDDLLPCLIQLLRATEGQRSPTCPTAILGAIAGHCRHRFEARLERRRSDDDWSINFSGGCGCEQCRILAAFLEDLTEQTLEWPLAQAGRGHIHRALDAEELPVRHQTRRSGRPYTLVLTKTDALFEREVDERLRTEADLAWLDTRSW